MSEIPKKLGKYEVASEISRGNMGTVYLGYDPYIDRQVAIKVAHSDSLNDPQSGQQFRKLFFNEAHTAGRLTHPNIISIYDAGVDQDICYIVMEYIQGGETLKNYIRPETLLPIEKVVEIIFKCAKALDYAHRSGIVHRDIKPSNILVTQDLDVKLGDFSIAHIIEAESTATETQDVMGSPRYMSPEQLKEERVTGQSDLFSLGLVMFELLTGKHPFTADNFSRLVHRVITEPVQPIRELRKDIPESLEFIVTRALEKDVSDRYAMGLDLATDLSMAFDNLEQPEEDISEQEKFNAIKELDFFTGFNDAELWEILRASTWLTYDDASDIIIEGELDDCFYIIISGSVSVWKHHMSIRVLEKGDCFGEMGYLAKTKRTASIKSNGSTSLLKINSTVISQVSLNCQVRFLKVFLRTLIHRLSVTTEKISRETA